MKEQRVLSYTFFSVPETILNTATLLRHNHHGRVLGLEV